MEKAQGEATPALPARQPSSNQPAQKGNDEAKEEEQARKTLEKDMQRTIRESERVQTKEEALASMTLLVDNAVVGSKRGLELVNLLRDTEHLNVEMDDLPLPGRWEPFLLVPPFAKNPHSHCAE